MDRVIGIDLGTFNSCVAVVEGGVPVVIANRGGYKVTPSMVAVTESGKRLVGHIAKRQAVTNAENTVYAAKRLIGRKWDTPQAKNAVTTCAYHIVEGPHGECRIELRDKVVSIPEISAMVLDELRTVAEDHLGESVEKAVITVPAYFNDAQRQATKDAGIIAGLDVIRIINEPTAAALAYGFGKNIDKTVAIFDLGGGTFDVSILDISSGGVFRVLGTAGDTFLGGEDFDQRIIDWLVQGFIDEYGIDLRQDRMALQRLKDAAEKAKCELSSVTETEVNLPFIISSTSNEALHLQRLLTRDLFESLTEDLVERTTRICELTLLDVGLSTADIEEIVLVGGMTRMPAIQQAVTALFGREPSKGVHPDEVVGLGAAIQGAALGEERGLDMVLLDVTPRTLGIMIAGGRSEALIPQNTTVPTSRSKPFTTVRDNQTAVKILVVQGEAEDAADNEILGEFVLTGLRRAPAGEVEIDVTFEINADGIVSVHAKDLDTGTAQSITVTASSGLSSAELASMIDEAQDYSIARRNDEEAERVRQQAATLIAEIEKLFPAVQELVAGSDFGRDSIEKARAAVASANALMRAGDISALGQQLDALARTQRMFQGVLGKSA